MSPGINLSDEPEKYHSAGATASDERRKLCGYHFLPVKRWLAMRQCPTGPLIGKETFHPGMTSRCKDAVLRMPFLVVESDVLTKPEMCAVLSWCRQSMKLRAIIDTAGKSLHGWFDRPAQSVVDELETILCGYGKIIPQTGLREIPGFKCDKSVFTPSQPVRLAGARRGTKIQSLIYLDL
jgi:hypothetical protein